MKRSANPFGNVLNVFENIVGAAYCLTEITEDIKYLYPQNYKKYSQKNNDE